MNTKLQDTINNLIEYITDYESGTFSSSQNELTRDQVESMAAYLIGELVIDEIDGHDLDDALNNIE